MHVSNFRFALWALSVLLLVFATKVNAITYSFSVDSAEVTGQTNALDDFDDGVLAPWTNNPTGSLSFGTVVESGGVLTLSSPGYVDDVLSGLLSGLYIERSDVFGPSTFAVYPGSGDFTYTSTWLQALPESPGVYLGMGFSYHVPSTDLHEVVSAGIIDMPVEYASALGVSSGLMLFWASVAVANTDDPVNALAVSIDFEGLPILAGDVTDDLIFMIGCNDFNDVCVPVYSLDGGNTFLFPFEPKATNFSSAEAGNLHLFADPWIIPEPSSLSLLALGFVGLVFVGRKTGIKTR